MALEFISLLFAFENSTKCCKISFDSDSFPFRSLGLLPIKMFKMIPFFNTDFIEALSSACFKLMQCLRSLCYVSFVLTRPVSYTEKANRIFRLPCASHSWLFVHVRTVLSICHTHNN